MTEPSISEQWKVIKDFPDYAVSDRGRVKRITKNRIHNMGKIMKQYKDKAGYMHISFSVNKKMTTFQIHRLVLIHFKSDCPKKHECNHKDGNKSNNNIENLEWVTRSKNQKHKYEILKHHIKKGEEKCNHKLFEWQVKEIRNLYIRNKIGYGTLAKKYNTCKTNIENIICRKTWNHI